MCTAFRFDFGSDFSQFQRTLAKWLSALAVLGTTFCSGQTPSPNPAPSEVAEVSKALRERQFTHAVALSRAALLRAPSDPRLWTLQALAYIGLNDSGKALGSYHHATRIAPDYLPALQGAAQLEYATHNPSAEQTLAHILKLQPSDQTAHAMLGEIAYNKQDCNTSAENFDQARDAIAGRSTVLMQYSACLVKLSKFADAIPILQQLSAAEPQNEAVRYDLALAEWNAGRPADAQAALEPALAGERPSGDDLTLAADIFESQGNTQRALDLLRRAIVLEPKNKNAYLDFAHLAYEHASMQVGINMLNLGLKQLPDEAQLYFARGVLQAQYGQIDLAFADFDEANRLDPRLAFVGIAQGIAQSQSHQSSAALARFREQVKQTPDNALAWYLLAEALSERNLSDGGVDSREAIAAARRAVQLDPKHLESRDLLASIYLRMNNPTEAIAQSREALEIDPKDTQALYQLVLATRKTNQKDQLPALVKRLVEARAEAQAQVEKSRPHTLVELPSPGSAQPN